MTNFTIFEIVIKFWNFNIFWKENKFWIFYIFWTLWTFFQILHIFWKYEQFVNIFRNFEQNFDSEHCLETANNFVIFLTFESFWKLWFLTLHLTVTRVTAWAPHWTCSLAGVAGWWIVHHTNSKNGNVAARNQTQDLL